MAGRRFKSRQSRRAYIVPGLAIALLAVPALYLFRGSRPSVLVVLAGAVLALAVAVIIVRGRQENIEYELLDDRLLLRRGGSQQELALGEVQDANLIDMASARNFVKEQLDVADGEGHEDPPGQHLSMRFCGVPLMGLAAVGSGIYRTQMSNFRRTLVLLRTRSGGSIILSPRYSESMVSAIEKVLLRLRTGEA